MTSDCFTRLGRSGTKRVFDASVAGLLVVLILPVLLAITIAIKLDGAGGVFEAQTCIGRHGRPFRLLRFRTTAAVSRGQRKGDRRVTRVGLLLKRTSMDQLPQILNVLRGEMSIVGPRPERPDIVKHLSLAIPNYDRRHSVSPGLTGQAQLNVTAKGSIERAREELRQDLYYVDHPSLRRDLAILASTVRHALMVSSTH